MSLLLSVATFGVGFVTRPLGALVIGRLADRHGRRPAMMLSLTLMGVGSLAIAALPTFGAWGIAAPLLLVAARLLQGLGFGAEIGTTAAFLFEAAPPGRVGRTIGWAGVSQSTAFLLVLAIGLTTRLVIGGPAMAAWGWRVPFALSVLLVPAGLLLRRAGGGQTPDADTGATDAPGAAVLAAIFVLLLAATVDVYFLSYVTTYAISALHFGGATALIEGVVTGLAGVAAALAVLPALDGPLLLAINVLSRLALGVLVWPLLLLLRSHPTLPVFGAVFAILAALIHGGGTAVWVLIVARFPARMRAAGFGLLYALTVGVFGGTAQVVFTVMIHWTGNPAAPAFYLAAINVVAAASLLVFRSQTTRSVPASPIRGRG